MYEEEHKRAGTQCSHIGQVDKLLNTNSGKSCLIEGGNCSNENAIYAAEFQHDALRVV